MDHKERREKWEREHPQHYVLRLTATEKKHLASAERKRKRMEVRLRRLTLVTKMRIIDKKTLQEIADEIGVTREWVRMLLLQIDPKALPPQ